MIPDMGRTRVFTSNDTEIRRADSQELGREDGELLLNGAESQSGNVKSFWRWLVVMVA